MKTCTADVGLTCANKFALGAPIGNPDYWIRALAKGCFGDLIPTYPVWAVTTKGSFSRLALKMIVSGPGQNLLVKTNAIFYCAYVKWINFLASSKLRTCTIIGSVRGLLLAL